MITYKIVEKLKDGGYKYLFHNRKLIFNFGDVLIAEKKMVDLNAASIEAGMKIIEGTCRSMGVDII